MNFPAPLNPFLAPILKRCWPRTTYEVEILQEEERVSVTPPGYLAHMLDRVTGTDEHSRLEDHLRSATETTVTHAPVIRFTHRNALVHRAGFATPFFSQRYAGRPQLRDLLTPTRRVRSLRYCYGYVSWRYFGHWLTDSIASALIEPERGELWMPPHPSWSHAPAYLKAFELNPLDQQVTHAEELVLYQDYGQGSHKQSRYSVLREKLRALHGDPDASECLFIRRGMTGVARALTNELELMDQLAARGWRVIDIASASVEEIQAAICRAAVVVSMDGSHLSHAHLSLAPGSAMVVLVPQDRFTLVHLGLCRANRIKPGFVVVKGSSNVGYEAELDEVLATVDRSLALPEPAASK